MVLLLDKNFRKNDMTKCHSVFVIGLSLMGDDCLQNHRFFAFGFRKTFQKTNSYRIMLNSKSLFYLMRC